MAIKKYYMTKDVSITNAYKPNGIYSASLSNDGAADSLQVFSIYNQTGFETSSTLNRKSRIFLKPDLDQLYTDVFEDYTTPRNNVQYWLKLYNVKHHENLPKEFRLSIFPVVRSFREGFGLDQDTFTDLDESNWLYKDEGQLWYEPGGDYEESTTILSIDGSYVILHEVGQYFKNGDEDLEVNVTELINYFFFNDDPGLFSPLEGFVIKLNSEDYENTDQSYYKKKFSSRSSEYFFKRPILEARWDSSRFDDRLSTFQSSSLSNREYTLYKYNYQNAVLEDIPGLSSGSNIYVSFYTNSLGTGTPLQTFTGSWYETGTYSVNFSLSQTGTLYDFWRNLSGTITYFDSTINILPLSDYTHTLQYKLSMPNLHKQYAFDESTTFRVIIKKEYNQNYYVQYQQELEHIVSKNLYYRIKRVVDGLIVIDYSQGTRLSYDENGNYFDFSMELLEKGYLYEISYFLLYSNKYYEQIDKFKFKVC